MHSISTNKTLVEILKIGNEAVAPRLLEEELYALVVFEMGYRAEVNFALGGGKT